MHVRVEKSVGGVVAPEKVGPPGPPGAASDSCLYPPIHVMSTLTLGGCHSALLRRNTDGFAKTNLFVCRFIRRSLMVAQLLGPGPSQLCVSGAKLCPLTL